MRIAIIGGGFYGAMAALESSGHKNVQEVTLYEKASDLFNGSAKFNQARLHQGYHYPRSPETIRQSLAGFDFYTSRFPNVTNKIKDNIYIIRGDGLVSPDSYIKTMQSFDLDFSEIDFSELPFTYKSNGVDFVALKVNEQWIDCSILELQIKNELRQAGVDILLNSEVIDIDCDSGIISTAEESCSYDLVVNCTYENPFIGFETYPIDLKYELCVMNLISSPALKDSAITIMDGEFVSVYPWIKGLHSVSSVIHTPVFKCNSLDALDLACKTWTVEEMAKQSQKIRDHVSQYLNFEYINIGSFYSKKVKLLNDLGDTREVRTFRKGKCLAVLPGKLDAVTIFIEALNKNIGV